MKLYLIGSLRNPQVPAFATRLRSLGIEVFDDWVAAGPEADDHWQRYEQYRGHSYTQALAGHAARHVFEYDKEHLDNCDGAVLLLPAGRSSHLELGYVIGRGKPGWIVLDDEARTSARFDVMYKFATAVFGTEEELIYELGKPKEVTQ